MNRFARALSLLALASCAGSETKTLINASGVMSPIGAADAANLSFSLYGAKDLVLGATPSPLGRAQVASDATWSASDVDVGGVSDAVVAVTDPSDATFFPTLSGLADYSGGQSKVDLDSGRLFAVPRSLVALYASKLGESDLEQQGFAMGVVSEGGGPVAGARVKTASNLGLQVWYPSADLTALSQTETSANGLFLIPVDPALLFLDLEAEKEGHAFAKAIAPLKAGTCSFAVILPAPGSSTPRRLVDVAGAVIPIGASSAAGATVQALAPYDYATSASPKVLAASTAGDAGGFSWAGVDVTNVAQGLLARVEDASGVFFPTVSGVTAWASEADAGKRVASPARIFAVSERLVDVLSAGLGKPELKSGGFAMGMATDGVAPVAGATIARADGKALTVIYPNAALTSLDGKATSANGLFILLPDSSLKLAALIAVKDGANIGSGVVMEKAGVCFFAAVRP